MEMASIGLSRTQKQTLETQKRRFEGELGGSHLSWGAFLVFMALGYIVLKEGGKPNEDKSSGANKE